MAKINHTKLQAFNAALDARHVANLHGATDFFDFVREVEAYLTEDEDPTEIPNDGVEIISRIVLDEGEANGSL